MSLNCFHGPTIAFKDYAMQFLAHAFDRALQKKQQHAVIVGATSGDTGSAALEAFKGRDAVDVFILFPEGRVSPVQQRQMTSVIADGAHAVSVAGDFDDCQAIVKALFNDLDFVIRINLSAINSIIGRGLCRRLCIISPPRCAWCANKKSGIFGTNRQFR